MNLKFLAHAAFLLTSDSGAKILIDPYDSKAYEGEMRYLPIDDKVDAVLITHSHADHSYISPQNEIATIIKQFGKYNVNNIEIHGIEAFHDKKNGKERGKIIIFIIKIDGITICHLGDLGHNLDQITLKAIGKIDILLLPVGGTFTIDANEATEVMQSLNPKICIPMHYKTERVNFDLAPVENFIHAKNNVKVLDESEIELNKDQLPETTQIYVLQMANF